MSHHFENNLIENAPNRLSNSEVKEIAKKINDSRLKINENIEHFVIHDEENGIDMFIPKRHFIPQISGKTIKRIAIEKHLRQKLEKLGPEKK
jgi:flavin-dependent dehydrogenase